MFFFLWLIAYAMAAMMIIIPLYPELLDSPAGGFEKYESDPYFLLLMQLGALAGTILAVWFMRRGIENLSFREFCQISFGQFGAGSVVGFAIVVVCSLMMLFCRIVSIQFLGVSTLAISILFFLLVAISEELVFRGYLLNVLLERMKPRSAIVLSSAVFSLFHILNDHFDVIGFVNIFLSGALFGLFYLRSKDLSAPIGLHFTWNLAQNVFGFAVSGNEMAGLFSLTHHSANPTITGGQFGLEGSILLVPFVLFAVLMVWRKAPGSISNSSANGPVDQSPAA